MESKRPKITPVMDERYPETPSVNHPPGIPRGYPLIPMPTSNSLCSGVGFASNMSASRYPLTASTSGNLSSSSYPAPSSTYLLIPPYPVSTSSYHDNSNSTYPRCVSPYSASSNSGCPASSSSYLHASSNKPYPASSSSYLHASSNKPYPASSSSYLHVSSNKPYPASSSSYLHASSNKPYPASSSSYLHVSSKPYPAASSSYLHASSNKPYPASGSPYADSSNRHYAASCKSRYFKPTLVYPDRHYPAPLSKKQRPSSFPYPSMGSRGYTSKFGPSRYVQKECQQAEIAALKQKLVDMEAKLMQVTAELELVKNERAYDKINFETEKCELESKIEKYKDQCSELQRENEKFLTEKEKLQSENEKLHRYLQDLESSNIKSQEKRVPSSNATSSNQQSLSEEEVAISADSAVVDQRSALQPQQINESNDDALGIDSLPDEMIVEVFKHLSQNQLVQIARVCRRWSVLTKSPVLWRKVDVKIFPSSDGEWDAQSFKSFIDGLPSCVTFIRLDFKPGFMDYFSMDFKKICMKLHQNNPQVKVLILERCDMSTSLPEVINSCTQFLQGLKKLVLRYCSIFKDYSGAAELKDNSKIEVLDLNASGFSRSSKIQFSKLLSLKELCLIATDVDDAWFVSDTSFLNHVQVLDLGWTDVTASTFRVIQRHGQNLKELYLCRLNLRDDDFSFNGPVFPHLQTICLWCTRVTCEGLVSLVQSCPSLVSVYVDEPLARSFSEHPFVVANRCKSRVVKRIDDFHNHNVDYSQN